MLHNYHTHTTYCDGKDTVKTFVEEAIAKRFTHLGFSSHAPVSGDLDFAIREEEIPHYLKDIYEMKQAQQKVTLFAGLECDFIPGITQSFSYFKKEYALDYIIGGVHLVKPVNSNELWFIDGSKRDTFDEGFYNLFDGHTQKAVTRFWEQTFEMIETEKFDIIAHVDKIKMHNQGRFFSQEENWYKKLVHHVLNLIERAGIIMEINSRGIYKGRCDTFYPSDYILLQAAKMDIPFVISGDAHKAEELGLLHAEAFEKLKSMEIRRMVYLEEGNWKDYVIL